MKAVQLLIAIGLAGGCIGAQAHAMLDHAQPRVGSTVHGAPAEVKLWFTEPLEPAFSTVHVVDAQGRNVEAGPAQVDAHDRLLVHVPLAKLAPGEYTAAWRAVSVDTHVTEGRFTFRVAP